MTDSLSFLAVPIAFVGLASWAFFYRLANSRWRFEFFTLDFLIGAILLSLAGAFTLGNLGSDLSFGDRLLVASKTTQALVFFGGAVFGLGALVGFGALRLLGVSNGLGVALSLASLIACSISAFNSSSVLPYAIATLCQLIALLLLVKSARAQDSPLPASRNQRQPVRFNLRRSSKGILLALACGFFVGSAFSIASIGMSGDFGLGPYAGMLTLTLGAFAAAAPFSLFLLNIAIDLAPGSLRPYWSKRARTPQTGGYHRWGLLAGMLWAAGALAFFTLRLAGAEPSPMPYIAAALGLMAAAISGIVFWKEIGRTKFSFGLLAGLCLLAISLLTVALTRNG